MLHVDNRTYFDLAEQIRELIYEKSDGEYGVVYFDKCPVEAKQDGVLVYIEVSGVANVSFGRNEDCSFRSATGIRLTTTEISLYDNEGNAIHPHAHDFRIYKLISCL